MRRTLTSILIATTLMAFSSGKIMAASISWDGGASTSTWSDANNWNPDGVPGSGDDVTINQNVTVNIGAATTINSLTLGQNGGGTTPTLNFSYDAVSAGQLTVNADMVIYSGATLTHSNGTSVVVGSIKIGVGGTLNLASGGSINTSSKGYLYSEGTGQGADGPAWYGNGGGGHGGPGGGSLGRDGNVAGGTSNDNVSDPVLMGSGGGFSLNASVSANGGGIAIITVTGTATINGTVNMNGENGGVDGDGYAGGGGAGGTFNLTANIIAGSTGAITANGGNGGATAASVRGGGGGGGRVSLKYTTSFTYSGTYAARGGNSSAYKGGVGTVFIQQSGTGGDLILDNSGITVTVSDPVTTLPSGGTYDNFYVRNYSSFRTTNNITVTNQFTLASGSIFENSSGISFLYGAGTFTGPYTLIDNGGTFNFLSGGGSLTIPTGCTLYANVARSYTSVTISGDLTHSANGTTQAYAIDHTVSGDYTINSSATVNINSKGYDQGYGPGKGTNGVAFIGSGGGGHGGAGGTGTGNNGTKAGGSTYGTASNPTTIGSGAGTAVTARNVAKGGGAIKLSVGGTLTLNTAVNANGGNGSQTGTGDADGGGSGGSVNFTANVFAGNGNITANGGNAGTTSGAQGGGGGGGLIKLAYGSKTWTGTATATGGTGTVNAGTTYQPLEVYLPSTPSSLSQYQSDGSTTISTGSITYETTVVLKTQMSAGGSLSVTPEFEVRPIGTGFSNTATHTGDAVSYSGTPVTGSATVTGLTDNTSYHWQVRVCGGGNCSAWVAMGGNPYDFRVATNLTPNSPSSLGPTSLADGSYTNDSTPTFTFTLSDPNGADTVYYTLQISTTSDYSALILQYDSALVAQGSVSFTVGQLTQSGLYSQGGSVGQTLVNGSYYWRVKATDSNGAASSWVEGRSGSPAFMVDLTAPTANGTSVTVTSVGDAKWTYQEPAITWTAGTDTYGTLLGYCVALSEVSVDAAAPTDDPTSTAGVLQGIDDGVTATYCPYIVTGTSLNLASIAGLSLTSNKQYYISLAAVDSAGNFYQGATNTIKNLRSFKYDSIAPINVASISSAGGTFSNIADMYFSWPVSGTIAASDAESGLLGYQYSLNDQLHWTGISTDSDTGLSIIPVSTTTPFYLSVSRDSTQVIVGTNIIYFRTIDIAGNPSSSGTYRTASIIYGGDAPVFAPDAELTVTPSTGTENSFALSWDAALPATNRTITKYYWMVNTIPPTTLETILDNPGTYFETAGTTVAAAALPAVVRGSNNVYVVAIDDLNNYSPSSYISSAFTLNTTSPDAPKNVAVSDASIKSASLWRASLAWGVPDYVGLGDLVYTVQRSSDGSTWSTVGTTSGTAYVDTVVDSARYYWRVGTKDSGGSGNSAPSYSNSVTLIPKGSYVSPADLTSGPSVGSITTKKAKITWTTNRNSDSKVAYGTKTGEYNDEEPSNSTQLTDHTINLSNLSPGTTYYYVAKWTDEDGNTGSSSEKSFSTSSAPLIKEANVTSISIGSAIINFTSVHASKVKVYYGKSTDFGGAKEIETSSVESTYSVIMSDLDDGTKYYYRLNTFDSEGAEYIGEIHSFETLPRPRISNVTLQQVAGTAETTIMVTWQSNTEISSILTYYPTGEFSQARDKIDLNLKDGEHSMVVSGLLAHQDYTLIVKGRDKQGNEAVSAPTTFTTASDTRPPAIINLKVVGGTIPPVGFAAGTINAQLVVTWDTDEPSSSQVEYGEGTGSDYSSKSTEDGDLTTNHAVVISGLTPSQVYHLRAVSNDSAGNKGKSVDTVTIAPKATRSALDLVMSNLTQIFGNISVFNR